MSLVAQGQKLLAVIMCTKCDYAYKKLYRTSIDNVGMEILTDCDHCHNKGCKTVLMWVTPKDFE